jgi:hypothetical protein
MKKKSIKMSMGLLWLQMAQHKTSSFINKTNQAKAWREMQLETSRLLMAKQHAMSFVPEIN